MSLFLYMVGIFKKYSLLDHLINSQDVGRIDFCYSYFIPDGWLPSSTWNIINKGEFIIFHDNLHHC